MSGYKVGAVLWIIHTDRPGLMAYQVIEEITKKTLEGEEIQYLVQAANPNKRAVKLETITGEIFQNSEEAKQKMIENATKAIDGMVGKIQDRVEDFFATPAPAKPKTTRKPRTRKKKPAQPKLKAGYQWVTMEDGTKAQVKMPEEMK